MVLQPWLAGRSTREVVAACGAQGVPVGAASGPDDLLADPQLLARSFFRDTPFGFALPASPIRLAGTREPAERELELESDAVPSPGQDTRHVLLAAGFTDEEVCSAVAAEAVFYPGEAFA